MNEELQRKLEVFKRDFSVEHWQKRAESLFPSRKVIVRMENKKLVIEGLSHQEMNRLLNWVDIDS